MAGKGRRTHALLHTVKGEQGEPFLPEVGQLYIVNTLVYFANDPAPERPAVVIGVPPKGVSHSPVRIVTRTTKLQVAGVPHPADRSCGCDRDGVFSDLASVEQPLWRPENVRLVGVLPAEYLAAVLERFR
jgi:hypothetical protein